MLLNLTDLSQESLQNQISRQIRAKILTGEIESGASLPSIRTLAREQKVSVITVQRAYEMLDRYGLIHSRRGKGFFVSEIADEARKDMALDNLRAGIQPHLHTAIEEGLSRGEIQEALGALLVQVSEDKG
jgi:GntR family transcriptional regulator